MLLFSNTLYCNILNNFVGGYSNDEPLLYKTPRLIFENFLNIKKLPSDLKNDNNYLDIIDIIYSKKEQEKNISFLDFYKYYKKKLEISIYNLVNNKYVDAKINKNNRQNIKYYYEYKTIDLDKNLIMEYIYILDGIKNDEKKKLFFPNKNFPPIYNPINEKITSRFIYNSFEKYYINSKYLDYVNILVLCIINILALSIHKKTLIPYTLTIYSLFQNLSVSVRKYTEIILSITLRLFLKEKSQNYNIYQKYFNLYQFSIEANGIFPNDELITLKKIIGCCKNEEEERFSEAFNERYKKIEKIEVKKLYSINCNKKDKDNLLLIQNLNISSTIGGTIKFKSKYYKNKEIKIENIYSPKSIYNITNDMLDNYYNSLDFKKINKIEYEKIIIHLLYYSRLIENKLPKDINKFLFYCFDLEY